MVEEEHTVCFALRQEMHVVSRSDPNIAIKADNLLFCLLFLFLSLKCPSALWKGFVRICGVQSRENVAWL